MNLDSLFSNPEEITIIVGPTASGKSQLALTYAKKFNGEIISCDSVQVYRGFDIGSAKPSTEQKLEIKHHLIDILDILTTNVDFNAAKYKTMALESIADILNRKKKPILVGGTGLYLRALLSDRWHEDLPTDPHFRESLTFKTDAELYASLKNIDPQRALELHPNDRFRITRALEINHATGEPVANWSKKADAFPYPQKSILLSPPRSILDVRIQKRISQMLQEGLIDEVKTHLRAGINPDSMPMRSIGYLQVREFIEQNKNPDHKIDLDDLREKIFRATRQYAKRQMTWFKKMKFDAVISSSDEAT